MFLEILGCCTTNLLLSFAGSGLPYQNEDEAFENTPNSGFVKVGGSFSFSLQYPNSYYDQTGKKYVVPEVKLQFCETVFKQCISINWWYSIPQFNWPRKRNWNVGLFYCNHCLPVRNQEQILKIPDIQR